MDCSGKKSGDPRLPVDRDGERKHSDHRMTAGDVLIDGVGHLVTGSG